MGLRGAKKEAALVAVAEVENEILDDQRPRDLPFAIFEMLGDIAHELRKLNAEEESSAITQPIMLQLTAGQAEVKTLHPGQLIKYIAIYSTPVSINIATGVDLGKPITTIPAGWQGVVAVPPSKDISFSWAAPAATGIVLGLISSHEIRVDQNIQATGQTLSAAAMSVVIASDQSRIPANVAIVGTLGDGTAASNVGLILDATATGRALGTFQYIFNGTTWDRARIASKFTQVALASATAEITIWTPGAGKKFRLMSFILTASVQTVLTFKDNTAGTTILTVELAANVPFTPATAIGNGILSAAANNVLTVTRSVAAILNGTLAGTEE